MVKNPPANVGDAGLIRGLEDPLEKEMATHSSIVAWEILWTEEPGGLQSMGLQELEMTEQQQLLFHSIQDQTLLLLEFLSCYLRVSVTKISLRVAVVIVLHR